MEVFKMSDPLLGAMESMMSLMRDDRAKYHLTLGEAIEALEERVESVLFDTGQSPRIDSLASYRGYYEDLALAGGDEDVQADELGAALKSALGEVYSGYKGGDYTAALNTPLWHAGWGDCGLAIIAVDLENGEWILKTKDLDD